MHIANSQRPDQYTVSDKTPKKLYKHNNILERILNADSDMHGLSCYGFPVSTSYLFKG